MKDSWMSKAELMKLCTNLSEKYKAFNLRMSSFQHRGNEAHVTNLTNIYLNQCMANADQRSKSV